MCRRCPRDGSSRSRGPPARALSIGGQSPATTRSLSDRRVSRLADVRLGVPLEDLAPLHESVRRLRLPRDIVTVTRIELPELGLVERDEPPSDEESSDR